YAPGDSGCTCQTACPAASADHAGAVYTHNGEEHLSVTDMLVPGRGDINFCMAREYRSRIQFHGSLGHNWDFSYNEHLGFEGSLPNGQWVTIKHVNGFNHVDDYGQVFRFGDPSDPNAVAEPTGSYTAPAEVFRTIKREANGWVILDWNGFKRH